MGQYYKCLTKGKKKTTAWSLQTKQWAKAKAKANGAWVDGYNGVKLMEHSWIGNPFMMGISKHIYKKPMQIAWVGDYADDFREWYGREPDPRYLHKMTWRRKNECDIHAPREFDLHNKYLVNHSKGVAIDFNDYIDNCTKDGWCIHPLSLLTACGNGMGGGDFNEDYIGGNMVGAWCWDTISIEDELPDGCEIEEIEFLEY